ncbi:CD109 [Mytilus edulis]|uniref:CD109 n=1 Tax=Mytilus edulis TaxID=6550 RepID=A0A8S3UEP4_MYTED|nr:CD109 [Mytilus edulis]
MAELGRPAPNNLKPVTKVRKLFPETWLWQNISSVTQEKQQSTLKFQILLLRLQRLLQSIPSLDLTDSPTIKRDLMGPSINGLEKLIKMPYGYGTRYWKHNAKESNEKKYSNWNPPHSQSNAIDIELTSYILMNYAMNNDVENGLPVLRWLTSQRNPNGGFASTQFDAQEQCVSLNIVRTDRVAELQPSPVRIYDYYEPSKQKTSFYLSKLLEKSTLCDVCGTECFCKEN